MFDGKRVLAVVPARGGSKGVKLKNLRKVASVPLVARVGHVVREVTEIDRAVVSTDHPEIASVAQEAGLDAPFMRPEALSGDRIGDWDVLTHALGEVEHGDGVTYDIIVMLQPTSPNRTAEQVRRTLAHLVEGGYDAVWTVSETDPRHHPLKQLVIDGSGGLDYYDPAGAGIIARQQLTPVYHRNGVAYAITRSCLMDQKTIKGARSGAVVIEDMVMNIDSAFDLKLADLILSGRLPT